MLRVMGVGANTLTVSGSGVADGAFAPAAGGSFYLQFVTGNLEGVRYRVLGNTSTVFTLDTAGESLSGHALGAIATGSTGDVVRIQPYWTLADVFGASSAALSIEPVVDFSGEAYVGGDTVSFFNDAAAGTDKKPAAAFAFVSGAGWRKRGAPDTNAAATELPAGQPFAVRRQGATAVNLLLVGYVAPERFLLRLPAVASGEDRDVAVALAFPAERSLLDSGLFSLIPSFGAIEASPDALNVRDAVLEFDLARRGFALPAAHRYHFSGTSWFESDTNADSHLLQPGSGYLLRLRGTHPARYWAQPSSN
jgi:uncharacterized protein (TIGR02597 family)